MKWCSILLFTAIVILFFLTPYPLIIHSVYNNGHDGTPYIDAEGIPFVLSNISYYWIPYLAVGIISVLLYFYNNLYTSIAALILPVALLVLLQYAQYDYMTATAGAYAFKFTMTHHAVGIILRLLMLATLVNLILEAIRLGRRKAKTSVQRLNDSDLLDSI